MKIAVMGTGGVGGYFGGLLARDNGRQEHEVTFIARGAHMAAINENGLRVESQLDGDFNAPGTATDEPASAGFQDLVLFTVKMYHNAPAIEAVRPMIGPDTVVLTLQNGIDNGSQLAEALGAGPVMIGSVYMEGRIKEPGTVTQGGPGLAVFGELDPGITSRGERLLKIFQDAGWRVDLAENMPGMLWKKFAYIAGSAAVNAATNTGYEEMRTIPETRELVRATIEEALSVGRALGAPIMEDSLDWAMTSLDNFPAQGRASLAKDFQEGNPVELDGLTGAVIRLGKQAGVPTPLNAALYAVLKPWALRIESSIEKK
jgi:2-dehydropantoate 2-reductase